MGAATMDPSVAPTLRTTTISTSGNHTITWPISLVGTVKIEGIGGGRNGTPGSVGGAGGGAGGGAYAVLPAYSVTPGGTTPCHVGAVGGEDTTVNTVDLVAKGGGASLGGAAASCTPTTGAFSGGARGSQASGVGGGGGASGNALATGATGANGSAGGAGGVGANGGGSGGNGGQAGANPGGNATQPGGSGGGGGQDASNPPGGNGAAGNLILNYTALTNATVT